MRALGTGDWHAGIGGALTLDDQEQVWHRIVELAIEQKCDLFLHAGDLFHGPRCEMEQLAAVRRVFGRLRDYKIPVLLIRGNSVHDLAVRPVDALDVFHDYDGIYVFTRPAAHVFANVGFAFLPWVSPAQLVAQGNGDIDRDHLDTEVARMLVEIAGGLRAELEGLPTVLLGHWSVSSGALPSGLPLGQLREPVLEWAELDALGFDAIVMGHIHKSQRLNDPTLGDATVGFYVGSPQPLSHGEPGEHGAWLLDIEPGATGNAVSAEFVPIDSPKFLTVEGSAETWLTLMESPMREWANAEGAIIRVRYTATEAEARRIDHALIRRELLGAGAARVTIEPTIIRAARARSEAITDQLSPLDALRAYCAAQETDEATTDRMVSTLKEWSEA